jgi:hypothetical protein
VRGLSAHGQDAGRERSAGERSVAEESDVGVGQSREACASRDHQNRTACRVLAQDIGMGCVGSSALRPPGDPTRPDAGRCRSAVLSSPLSLPVPSSSKTGSQSKEDESHGSTQEVPRRVA